MTYVKSQHFGDTGNRLSQYYDTASTNDTDRIRVLIPSPTNISLSAIQLEYHCGYYCVA